MPIVATLTATGEPLEDFPWTFEAGQTSPPIEVTLTNQGPGPVSPAVIKVEALSPTVAGQWLAYGAPILDEQWVQAAIVGSDGSAIVGGSLWTVPTTVPTGLGAGRGLVIPEWPEGGVVFVELTARPPGSTLGTGGQRIRLGIQSNENAIGSPIGAETGIVSGVGLGGYSALILGAELTYKVAPDPTDEVTVAESLTVLDGAHRWTPAVDIVLDQLDGDDPPVALASGESYRAVGYAWVPDSEGAPFTAEVAAVKGLKSASGSPEPPAPPAGAAIIFDQKVNWDVGGTSVLLASDLVRGPWRDRFLAEPDPSSGLNLIIGPGEDVGYGVRRIRPTPTPVTFAPNIDGTIVPATSVWLDGAGALQVSTTLPDTQARLLWDGITTDATDVLTWRDRRQFPRGEVVCQELASPLDSSLEGLEIAGYTTIQDAHVVEMIATLYRDGLASAGTTIVDVTLDADPEAVYDPLKSIWPAGGTPLSWADDATGGALTIKALVELPEIPQGTRLGLWLVDLAVGGLPSRVHVCMVGHRTG